MSDELHTLFEKNPMEYSSDGKDLANVIRGLRRIRSAYEVGGTKHAKAATKSPKHDKAPGVDIGDLDLEPGK